MARAAHVDNLEKDKGPEPTKRENSTPIQELELNNISQKRTKVSDQNKTQSKKFSTNGGEVVATEQHHQAQ